MFLLLLRNCGVILAIMAEEVKVVLKRSEDSSFGFSLLGTTGLPHVIYDIIADSPAAECGVVREVTSRVMWLVVVCCDDGFWLLLLLCVCISSLMLRVYLFVRLFEYMCVCVNRPDRRQKIGIRVNI